MYMSNLQNPPSAPCKSAANPQGLNVMDISNQLLMDLNNFNTGVAPIKQVSNNSRAQKKINLTNQSNNSLEFNKSYEQNAGSAVTTLQQKLVPPQAHMHTSKQNSRGFVQFHDSSLVAGPPPASQANQSYTYSQKLLAKRTMNKSSNNPVHKKGPAGHLSAMKASLEGGQMQKLENLIAMQNIEDVMSMSAGPVGK